MIRCSKCGTLNSSDSAFCSECNAYLEWTGERIEDTPGPAPAEMGTAAGSAPGAEVTAGASLPADPGAVPASTVGPPADDGGARAGAAGEPAARPPSGATEQPGARRPSKADTATRPKPKATTTVAPRVEELKPGDRVCPACGSGNDAARKFCRRCGASLGAATLVEATPPPRPWYRRLRGGAQRAQTFGVGERPVRMGTRRWRPGCGSLVLILLVALGVGSVLSYLYVPSVSRTVDDIVRTVRTRIDGVTVINPIASSGAAVSGHPAGHAVDGDPETFWLGEPGQAARWRLNVRFERRVDLRQVDILPGASGDDYREHGRPRLVVFRSGDRSSDQVVLEDSGEKQSIQVALDDIDEVRLVVLETYGGTDALDDVAVREIVYGVER